MSLTKEERDKFAAYLEQDAYESQVLVEQLKTLPGGEILAKKLTLEIAACHIVATKLRSVENQTL